MGLNLQNTVKIKLIIKNAVLQINTYWINTPSKHIQHQLILYDKNKLLYNQPLQVEVKLIYFLLVALVEKPTKIIVLLLIF